MKLLRISLILGLILSMSNTFSESRVLKNELPKSEREFFENDFKKSGEENLDKQEQVEDEASLPKFFIKKIYLKRDRERIKPLVSHKRIDKILKEYENREINIVDLRELVKRLNEEYTKKGYITTRVYLEPEQDISNGTVKLVVLEGKLEEIVIDGDTSKDKRKAFFAFTNEKNKILNISHIDNGVDNLNRVESNNSQINIVPGEKQGYSKVIIESVKKKPIRFNLEYENTQKDKQKYSIGFEYDNLLGMNDILYFNYKGDTGKIFKDADKKDDYTESITAGYSFPVKTWTYSLNYSNSKENTLVAGNTTNYHYRVKSNEYGINATKLLFRNQNMKLNMTMGLGVKNERTYIDETRLKTQDRDITVASAGLNGVFKPYGGIASYSLVYSKGIKGFGSKEDKASSMGANLTPILYKNDNRYNFDKINVNLSYYKPFYFGNQGLTLRTTASGQYTKDSLFSSEKYSIGSYDTVKGFPTTVSGDNGFNTKVELTYILPSTQGSFFNRLRPYVEYDFGKVRNSYDDDNNKGGSIVTLSSYSAGVKYYGEILTLDMGIAKTDKGRRKVGAESHRGYISLNASF